ncbi:cold-shock protein [candidate division KSB1 bacterium]
MKQGIIREFDRQKFFGFIELDGEPDIFFHGNDVEPKWRTSLGVGDIVQFNVATDIKGLKAIKIRKV